MSARYTLLLLTMLLIASPGCRAIRRFGDSRQSIAARRLSGQGFQAIHDGRWEVAESLFTDALDVSSADDRAHWGLAEAYWNRGDQSLAVNEMEQAVRLSAGDPKFVRRLGEMYLDLGRLADADQQSQLALNATRDSPSAWQLRGDCLRAAGQDDEALAAYHRALALQPDFPGVQIKAAEIYRSQQRYDRLLATLDRLRDGGGEDTAARVDVLQGIAMRNLDRKDEARRFFAKAIDKDPSDVTAHLELASLEIDMGNIQAAHQSISLAMQIDPASVPFDEWTQRLSDEQSRLASDPFAGPALESSLR